MVEVALVVVVVLLAAVILALVMMRRQSVQPDTSRIDERLDSLNRQFGQVTSQASTYQETVNAVHRALGELTGTSQRILEVGQDMRQLQEVLAAPTFRGALGELLLEDLLRQVLPEGVFETQYTFRSGRQVDAIIRLTNGIVPVDAKFPLESFRRLIENPDERQAHQRQFRNDVRRHIDAIAERYIIPGETLDFALMYIPSENIYYEVLRKDTGQEALLDYAWAKRVVPSSPNSLYAYLQVIALGLRGLQIEQNARVMLDSLTRLQGDFDRFADDYRLIGTHLNRAQAKYSEALPKLDSLRRALPGRSGDYTPAIEEPAALEAADSEVPEIEWEYNPPQRRRGCPRKRYNE